jgi:Na+/melibiose symporter-like transporter
VIRDRAAVVTHEAPLLFKPRAVCSDAQLLSQVGSGVIGIVGALFLVTTVNWLGKRFLSLVALAGNGVSCLLLGVYSYVVLRPGGAAQYKAAWLPLALIIVLSFCTSVMFEVPWMMLSEVFPFRYGETAVKNSAVPERYQYGKRLRSRSLEERYQRHNALA